MTDRDSAGQQELASEVQHRLAGLRYEMERRPDYLRFVLPLTEGSDYWFELYVYEDGEPQITAVRQSGARGTQLVWALPFEHYDFEGTGAAQVAFLEKVDTILRHRTRLTHTTRALAHNVRCEYQTGASWALVGSFSWAKGASTPTSGPPLDAGVLYCAPLLADPAG